MVSKPCNNIKEFLENIKSEKLNEIQILYAEKYEELNYSRRKDKDHFRGTIWIEELCFR
jgi:hypothetical protein